MADIWFTSDLHLFDERKIPHYPTRSMFENDFEMSRAIIANINSVVKPQDTLYIIGDFGRGDTDSLAFGMKCINGKKRFVPGNHDRKVVKSEAFLAQLEKLYQPLDEVVIKGQLICLCHFPIWEWNRISCGSWHLHGHKHGRPTGIPGKILDVSADGNNLMPYHFDEIKAHMDALPVRHHFLPDDKRYDV